MRSRLLVLFGMVGLVASGAVLAFGQNQTVRSIAGDKWVITAEAGGVNHIEGGVNVARTTGKNGRLLKGDAIAVGDRVQTESNGRAEILLNPGSYVRIAGGSEFEFKTTALEDLQLRLTKGSAIFEVFATNDFRVLVEAPKAKINLIESGVYRVDVLADGTSRLEVWKGKAEVAGQVVKGGRVAIAADGAPNVAKFDRDEKDEFELWSRSRAKDLAKSNSDLKNRDMRTALMRSYLGGRWNTYNSFGLWVFNAQYGRYCFLPFGWGWSSPYGYGFGADIWWYRLPPVVFYPPAGGGNGGTGGDGNVGGGQGRGRRPPPDRQPIEGQREKRPPFADVQGGPMTGRKFGGDLGGGGYDQSGGGFTPGPQRDSTPVYAPTPKSAPMEPGPSRDVSPLPAGKGRNPID